MIYFLSFLVLIGILMIPHEWGHYFVARLARMKVYEYSVGAGPEIFSRVRNDVKFSLRPIPILAYVRIAGMEPSEADHPEGFNSKSIGWRFAVLMAGSTMNMLVALIIFVAAGMTFGKVVGSRTFVREVDPKMPGYDAGFREGDEVLSVGGKAPKDTAEFIDLISSRSNQSVPVNVQRAGKTVALAVVPKAVVDVQRNKETGKVEKKEIGRIGVVIQGDPIFQKAGAVESIKEGFYTTVVWTQQILVGIVYTFTHREGLKHVGGPLAIAKAAGDSAKKGLAEYAWFAGVISINLAVFNLLPLLALDGGRILFLIYEVVRRRRPDPQKEFIANAVGMALLFLLLLVITAKDIHDWIVK